MVPIKFWYLPSQPTPTPRLEIVSQRLNRHIHAHYPIITNSRPSLYLHSKLNNNNNKWKIVPCALKDSVSGLINTFSNFLCGISLFKMYTLISFTCVCLVWVKTSSSLYIFETRALFWISVNIMVLLEKLCLCAYFPTDCPMFLKGVYN